MTHEILPQIEAYIQRTGMKKTRFGQCATGEGRLVQTLREGRKPSKAVAEAVLRFMASNPDGVPTSRKKPVNPRVVDQVVNHKDFMPRVDGIACFNCGAAYARCGCHGEWAG